MTQKIGLPLTILENYLVVLDNIYVHAQAPVAKPVNPGLYRALIDTGASHTWVKPKIGDTLNPHSLDGYVLDRGDGKEEDLTPEVKFGFQKGLKAKPVKGYVQLDVRFPAYELLLFSGDFDAPTDVVLGMDVLFSFIQCGIVFKGTQEQPLMVFEF
jgi:hypothetical protein